MVLRLEDRLSYLDPKDEVSIVKLARVLWATKREAQGIGIGNSNKSQGVFLFGLLLLAPQGHLSLCSGEQQEKVTRLSGHTR